MLETKKLNNIYVIDGKMWGFKHYMSAFIVEGKELALIDTSEPNQCETVKAAIKNHGFDLKDFKYLFITHAHQDHAGNAAPLLREMPKAKVYVHPAGEQRLTNPAGVDWANRLGPGVLARRKEIEPVSPDRIQYLNDGDTFDLGDGEVLKIMFAPGHQPTGIVIFEKKNNGCFINDLVGNCFLEADCQYVLNPLDSDNIQVVESLQKIQKFPLKYLYMGHFGVTDECQRVINKGINNCQTLLDIGRKYAKEGKPDIIAQKTLEFAMPEIERLKKFGREDIYQYASVDHVPFQSKLFAKYCMNKFAN